MLTNTQLTEDIDPSFAKKTTGLTFEEVARRWFERWSAGRHERHAYYVLCRLEADVQQHHPVCALPHGVPRADHLATLRAQALHANETQRNAA